MSTLEALLEVCLLLNSVGPEYRDHDVIIKAYGVYQFVPSWDYQATVDKLCSLDKMQEVTEMQPRLTTVVEK